MDECSRVPDTEGQELRSWQLHKLLTNAVYIGRWKFNQASSKTRKRKADDEVIEIPVPAIVELDTFEQVRRQLHARSPKRQPPRMTTGPILLTGLAVCATCRGGMTLRTGTSKGGRVYRYYTCSNCATKGKTACKGRSIPMGKLDALVTDHLLERLFKPERLALILASLSSRRAEQAAALNTRIVGLQREMIEADDKLKRLYRLVEDGLTDLDEVLQDRLHTLKADRDRAKAALERAKEYSVSHIRIDPALIERFGRTMREKFSTGSVPFRKAYLRSLIDAVEVDDHQIRIKGNKELLEKAVLATQSGQSWCSQTSTRALSSLVAIALVCEVVLAFLRADGCEGLGDRRKECVDRPGGSFSQQCFELCEELFDGIEVGTVGRQVAQLGAGGFNRLANADDLVAG